MKKVAFIVLAILVLSPSLSIAKGEKNEPGTYQIAMARPNTSFASAYVVILNTKTGVAKLFSFDNFNGDRTLILDFETGQRSDQPLRSKKSFP